MSVGIFKNGKYNKVAGNAKDSTATNTTYNNGTSGLQANNVQSAIDELDSTVDTLNSNLGNKYAAIETDVTTTQKVISYPNGFNYNNCVVTTLYLTPYGTWVSSEYDQSMYGCEVLLSDRISVTAKTDSTKKIRMLLTRIDL